MSAQLQSVRIYMTIEEVEVAGATTVSEDVPACPPPSSSTIFLLLTLFTAVGVPPPLHVPWSLLATPPPASLYQITITLLLLFLAPPEPEHSVHFLSVVTSIIVVARLLATNGVDSILSSDQPSPTLLHLPAPPSSSTSSTFFMAASPIHVRLSCASHFPLVRHPPPRQLDLTTLLSLPLPFVEHLPTCLIDVLFVAILVTYRHHRLRGIGRLEHLRSSLIVP